MSDAVFHLVSVWVAAATAFLAGYVTAEFGFVPGTVLAWSVAVLGQIMLAYAVRKITKRRDLDAVEREP